MREDEVDDVTSRVVSAPGTDASDDVAVVAGRLRGPADGIRLAARIAAFGELDQDAGTALPALLENVARGLGTPVAHLTRSAPDGIVLLGHHGLHGVDGRVETGESFGATGPVVHVLTGGGPQLVTDARLAGVGVGIAEDVAACGAYAPVQGADGAVWGCLAVEHHDPDALDEHDLDLLASLGAIVGSVLVGIGRLSQRREEALRERGRRRSSEAGAAVVTAGLGVGTVREAAAAMVRAARTALDWPPTSLLRWTGAGWLVEAAEGHPDGTVDLRVPSRGVLAAAHAAQQTLVGAVESDDVLLGDRSRSRLAAPIRVGGSVRYLLLVESEDPHALDETSRGDAVAVGARIALVLERLELLAVEQQAAHRLAEADRMRANLLTVAGHELRTPLTVVLGYAETLREQADRLTSDQLRGAVGKLAERASYLSELVDRVLLAARLESDGVDVVRRTVRLGDVVADAPWAQGVTIGDGLADGVVAADPDWLARALEFLVEHCRRAARSTVTLDARLIGDRAAVMVRDDGEGIAGYERERVFRPFDGTGTAGSEVGLGPGLARGLVRAMGGELRLYSALGYGSTFVVVLPVG